LSRRKIALQPVKGEEASVSLNYPRPTSSSATTVIPALLELHEEELGYTIVTTFQDEFVELGVIETVGMHPFQTEQFVEETVQFSSIEKF